jgi:hypothetical protein
VWISSRVTSHACVSYRIDDRHDLSLCVRSRDAAGNLATSGDGVFLTLAAVDTTEPVISAVAASSITTASAVVNWTTNEPADTQVEYRPDNELRVYNAIQLQPGNVTFSVAHRTDREHDLPLSREVERRFQQPCYRALTRLSRHLPHRLSARSSWGRVWMIASARTVHEWHSRLEDSPAGADRCSHKGAH